MARRWMCVLMLTLPALAFADQGAVTEAPISGGSAAAGGAHSVLSFPDGGVVAWGKGSQGQLGNGDHRSRSTPTPVPALGDITMVAAGSAHTLARSTSGRVFAWGANGSGQLGDGSYAARKGPVQLPLLNDVVAVAAGRAHSLALTADGRVFAWGANDQGQLGLGSTIDASIPTEITALSGIIAIAAGHSHSLAVSSDGALFAWGGNAQGQLGDGSRTFRVTPVRINLSAVVAVAAGRSHTLALLQNGDVYSWGRGRFGQLGTGSTNLETRPRLIEALKAVAIEAGANFSAAVRADRVLVTWGANRLGQLGDGSTIDRPRPVEVRGLIGISTLAMGDAHAIAVTSDGSVWTWGSGKSGRLGTPDRGNQTAPATAIMSVPDWGPPLGTVETPTIDPPGGLYARAQTVVLKTNDGFAEIRYTLDGTEPTTQSALYSQPFLVSTATTVRARAFVPLGGGASDISTAVFAFRYGELPVPVMSPRGGTFAKAPVVTITALPGASIRYTLDGTDPNDGSALYTSPIEMPVSGAQLRARAWHVDWTPSAIVTESYRIDVTPPTIVAEVFPPLSGDWMTTPVTVTFKCEDDSADVVCSAPVVVDSDGRDQVIRGTATDAAGNQASTSVNVSMDLGPPAISLADSPDQTTVTQPEITLDALVTDDGSGVDRVWCNGAPLDVSNGVATCVVALRPGVNSITMRASDVVGHAGSIGLTVTRVGVASSIQLSPAHRTMLVDEVATFSLRDDFGVIVFGGAWSSSDEAVITLSDGDPPRVTAIAPGAATISAVKDGLETTATVTVRSGVELAPGTTRWSMTPAPGRTMQLPLYTTRVDATVPPLFIVETSAPGEATLYAATPDGEILWRQESPGVPLMGDSFGGVIAGVLGEFQHSQYRTLLRLGNAGGVAPWRYDSPGNLLAPAQSVDGTIYAVEYIRGARQDGSEVWDKYATVIDGRNGRLVNRTPLAREIDTWITTTPGCPGRRTEEAPQHAGPVVGPDGRGYLLVRRYERTKTLQCFDGFRMPRTIDLGMDLLILSAPQAPVVEPLHSAQCVAARDQLVVCDAALEVRQVLPDGAGGVLATWRRATHLTDPNTLFMQTSISRRTEAGSLVDMPVPEPASIHSVGQAGVALVIGAGTFSAFDVTTATMKWSTSSSGGWPIAADPEGGAMLLHPTTGQMRRVTSSGDIDDTGSISTPLITAHHQFGGWLGVTPDGLHAVAGSYQDATRWQPATGNVQRNLRQATPGIGIFAKAHLVSLVPYFMHVSVRITPRDPLPWRAHPTWGRYFRDYVDESGVTRPAVDRYGNVSATLGAGPDGPNGEDTTMFCLFNSVLKSRPNRPKDQSAMPSYQQELELNGSQDFFIARLFELDGNYRDQLKYECVPDDPDEFNSNSYASGLLGAANIRKPWFPQAFPSMFPGWSKPIPADFFKP